MAKIKIKRSMIFASLQPRTLTKTVISQKLLLNILISKIYSCYLI